VPAEMEEVEVFFFFFGWGARRRLGFGDAVGEG
jgi:hypothetical protein